ncbi:hypothetical protein Tco_1202792 [Tanacetum coccineum]
MPRESFKKSSKSKSKDSYKQRAKAVVAEEAPSVSTTPAPAPVKADELIVFTLRWCPFSPKLFQPLMANVYRTTFLTIRYLFRGQGHFPGNTVTNPREDLNVSLPEAVGRHIKDLSPNSLLQ